MRFSLACEYQSAANRVQRYDDVMFRLHREKRFALHDMLTMREPNVSHQLPASLVNSFLCILPS